MASIRITNFAGLAPEVSGKLIDKTNAQIAHNCILTDGKLRPHADWVKVDAVSNDNPTGIIYDKLRDKPFVYRAYDPVALNGPPFATDRTVGIANYNMGDGDPLQVWATGDVDNPREAGVRYAGAYGTVTYTRSYDSDKPINRIYAISWVRREGNNDEEGPLSILPGQSPTDIVYEGDLVRVQIYPYSRPINVNYVRLYRTITGLDTGQSVTNELDTNWHLVAEMPAPDGANIVYVDGASATALPLDVYHADTYHPLHMPNAKFFGMTEGGWFVAVSTDGKIAVSERYKHHAWPTENYLQIPETVTDIAIHKDNVYFGTTGRPYIMAVGQGDKAMQANIVPYDEHMPCRENTMTVGGSGALYASNDGIVSLTRDGMEVITRNVANASSNFATYNVVNFDMYGTGGNRHVRFNTTKFGYYHKGVYYGFCYEKRQEIIWES